MLNFGKSKKTGFHNLSQYLTTGELKLVSIGADYPTSFLEVFLSLQEVDAVLFRPEHQSA